MGKISERIRHVKIIEGYCLICGEYGKLSIDHVPPQGAVTITKVEQRHVCEMMGKEARSFKGVKSTNGSKFRTICTECNSKVLGPNDIELARVNKELIDKIIVNFQAANNIYNTVATAINAIQYARAMIGHILSATSVTECQRPAEVTPYFSPLREFVLGNNDALNESHDIYYWFYPSNRHVSAKYVCFHNQGHSTGLSLLSFFPVAFLVTNKNEGIYPAHAQKFELNMNEMILSLSSLNIKYADFPFVELTGNSMYLLSDHQAIISYPVGS